MDLPLSAERADADTPSILTVLGEMELGAAEGVDSHLSIESGGLVAIKESVFIAEGENSTALIQLFDLSSNGAGSHLRVRRAGFRRGRSMSACEALAN